MQYLIHATTRGIAPHYFSLVAHGAAVSPLDSSEARRKAAGSGYYHYYYYHYYNIHITLYCCMLY